MDWAGPTIPVQQSYGSVRRASLFTSALGASSYTYAEAVEDQQMANWLKGADERAGVSTAACRNYWFRITQEAALRAPASTNRI